MEAVPKSTQWYRDNKEAVHKQQNAIKRTLNGKLTNLITTSRYRCKISKREHTIDTAYLKSLYIKQEGKCAITGTEMEIRGTNCAADSPYSISLDRIDSELGYIDGNVWLVCTGINLMKSRLSMDQFIDFCRKVIDNHG
jgi:hypothetical protein